MYYDSWIPMSNAQWCIPWDTFPQSCSIHRFIVIFCLSVQEVSPVVTKSYYHVYYVGILIVMFQPLLTRNKINILDVQHWHKKEGKKCYLLKSRLFVLIP